MRTSKKNLFCIFRSIARRNGLKIRIYTRPIKENADFYCSGRYSRKDRKIVLNIPKNYNKLSNIVHVFYHEFCHHLCYENGIFPNYHKQDKDILQEGFLISALQAERGVDAMARRMYIKLYPKLIYADTIYDNKEEGYKFLHSIWWELINLSRKDQNEAN